MNPAEQMLLRTAQGYQLSQALYVAAKLGVADLLAEAPRTAPQLAKVLGVQPDPLARVLRALVVAGIFVEEDDGAIGLNEAAEALRSDAPARTRDVIVNFGEEMYQSFGSLLHTVQTGETAFNSIYGMPLFDYYGAHPDVEAAGSARMTARTLAAARELAASDLLADGTSTVIDVGGGRGTVVAELLAARQELRAVLVERAPVLRLARAYLDERGVGDRCDLVEGDFFSYVPGGGDHYLLKSVLHDWDDERCVTILSNCREAMHERARLGIVEYVLPPRAAADPEHLPSILLDLIMLTYAGGRERTEPEFAALLERSGLRLVGLTPLEAGPYVIEAVRA